MRWDTQTLLEATDELVGLPYKLMGRDFTPGTGGTDCVGLTWHVAKNLCGVPVDDFGVKLYPVWSRLMERAKRIGGEDALPRVDFRRFMTRRYCPPGWQKIDPPYQGGDIGFIDDGVTCAVGLGGGWFMSSSLVVGAYRFRERRPPTPLCGVWRYVGGDS